MAQTVRIGTRGSKLALAQAEMMAAALREAHPGLAVELRIISTVGDRTQASGVALAAVGDKGLFVKELEIALMTGEVDLAVHSCKDLPSLIPDGLTLAAFPQREQAWDALVMPVGDKEARRQGGKESGPESTSQSPGLLVSLSNLPSGARVGTSSLRRASQLRALRPDLEVLDVRGNVDTRLRKLDEGQYDVVVLAAAGLIRLGLGERISQMLPPEVMLPAVAQGALAIEARADDEATLRLLAPLDDPATRATTLAERAFLRRLEGGCQVPIAGYATLDGGRKTEDGGQATSSHDSTDMAPSPAVLRLQGFVGALDGSMVIRGERTGRADDPETLGTELAEELIERGAATLLKADRYALSENP